MANLATFQRYLVISVYLLVLPPSDLATVAALGRNPDQGMAVRFLADQLPARLSGSATAIALSNDEEQVAVGVSPRAGYALELIDLKRGEVGRSCFLPGSVNRLAYSKDDKNLFVASGQIVRGESVNSELLKVSMSTLEITDRIPCANPVKCIAVSEDGTKIAFATARDAVSHPSGVQILDAATFKPLHRIQTDTQCVDLRFTAESSMLICGQQGRNSIGGHVSPVLRIDVSSGKRLAFSRRISARRIGNVCPLPDGRVVIDDRSLCIYDLDASKFTKLKTTSSPMPTGDLFYVPNRQTLISSWHTIRNATIPITRLNVTSIASGETIGTIELVDKVTAPRSAITKKGTRLYFGGNREVHVVRIRYKRD